MALRRCVVLKGFGGYDKVKVEYQPLPDVPSSDQVRVKVRMCGINFADIYQRQGILVDAPKKPPLIMGLECSGTVDDVGSEVTTLKKGDRVMCYNSKGGMYADVVVTTADKCFSMPDSMSFEEGAAFLVNYLTSHFALFEFGNLRKGQTVFIHSIAGGVGCAATQLARTVPDVKIFGTSSKRKATAAMINGAENVFDYSSYHTDLTSCCPKGVDIFVDNFSGQEFCTSFGHLSALGKLIHMGANSVITGEKRNAFALIRAFWGLKNVSVLKLVSQNQAVCGLNLANLMESDSSKVLGAVNDLRRAYVSGKLKPKIDSVWNVDRVVEGMQRLANRENIGKVVISF